MKVQYPCNVTFVSCHHCFYEPFLKDFVKFKLAVVRWGNLDTQRNLGTDIQFRPMISNFWNIRLVLSEMGGADVHIIIIIIIIIMCTWVDIRWHQYTFTHKQYTEYRGRNTHNSYKGKKITRKKLGSKLGSAGRAPSLRVIPWHLPYNWGESTENPHSHSAGAFVQRAITKGVSVATDFARRLICACFRVCILLDRLPVLKCMHSIGPWKEEWKLIWKIKVCGMWHHICWRFGGT
jgi:hypothetical protein